MDDSVGYILSLSAWYAAGKRALGGSQASESARTHTHNIPKKMAKTRIEIFSGSGWCTGNRHGRCAGKKYSRSESEWIRVGWGGAGTVVVGLYGPGWGGGVECGQQGQWEWGTGVGWPIVEQNERADCLTVCEGYCPKQVRHFVLFITRMLCCVYQQLSWARTDYKLFRASGHASPMRESGFLF